MKYSDLKENKEIKALIEKGNSNLGVLGYTDHSQTHAALVANRAADILKKLGYKKSRIELAKMAGYMHDIGNAINRSHHAEYGAILAYDILKETDMDEKDRLTIVSAISHHDESTGVALDDVSAALIIADKTDVRRNRVRCDGGVNFDIHDQVNYAVTNAELLVDTEKKVITLNLTVDEEICTMYEYFEIFLGRMMMSRRAAEMLGMKFKLRANGSTVL